MKDKRSLNLREKYLDAEMLFRKYIEDGETRSIYSLVEWATEQGMKSPQGRNPTTMGVWKAMWRWASLKENKDKAWEIAKDAVFGKRKKKRYTKDQWDKEMIYIRIPSAWQHVTDTKKNKFLRENGWM